MTRTRAQLEKENAQLWQKLESIYDELHELFVCEKEEDDENEEE